MAPVPQQDQTRSARGLVADPFRRIAVVPVVYLEVTAEAPRPITFVVRGPIGRADLPGLFDRVCRLLASNQGGVVHCDVAGLDPDAVTVDALARLQLAARRNGCLVRLRSASAELLELVALLGLADTLTEWKAHRTE